MASFHFRTGLFWTPHKNPAPSAAIVRAETNVQRRVDDFGQRGVGHSFRLGRSRRMERDFYAESKIVQCGNERMPCRTSPTTIRSSIVFSRGTIAELPK